MLIRLPSRKELWDLKEIEALKRAPHVIILDPKLEASLLEVGVRQTPKSNEQTSKVAYLVPMHPVEELVLLVNRLLGPGGCPWDQAQTHESLKKHLIEEAYEVVEAIDLQNPHKLQEELGDLLLQPIMIAQIAENFETTDCAEAIVDKLIRRHPHVFGDVIAEDAETVLENWDSIKKSEGLEPKSILEGVPTAMPALQRAYEISKRAARQGFEWPDLQSVWDKLSEEIDELKSAETQQDIHAEVGDLLFTAVNLARWYKVEPEDALRTMLNRFSARFREMERSSPKPLTELSTEEWDTLWSEAKTKTK